MLLVDLFYACLLLFTFPLWLKYVFNAEYRRVLRGRWQPGHLPAERGTIWIHAVSVGEVRSLKGFILQLQQSLARRVLLTVTTPAGLAFARRQMPGLEVWPAPFDFSFTIRRFIKAIQPALVIFNELELWPNWVFLLHRQGVPILLINGRITEKAWHRYRKFRLLARFFLRRLNGFVVQSTVYADRFEQIGVPRSKMVVCGNIKADEACSGLEQLPQKMEILRNLGLEGLRKKVVVIASSHAADERVVIPAIPRLQREFFFILVPRHPERLPDIERHLEHFALNYRVFTRREKESKDEAVLVYDLLGFLFHVLAVADVVYMGGTQRLRVGGHNLYEPAVLGKMIIGGAHYQSFSDIGQELEQLGAYRRVHSSDELVDFLVHMDPVAKADAEAAARAAVLKRRGSVACAIRQVQRLCGS